MAIELSVTGDVFDWFFTDLFEIDVGKAVTAEMIELPRKEFTFGHGSIIRDGRGQGQYKPIDLIIEAKYGIIGSEIELLYLFPEGKMKKVLMFMALLSMALPALACSNSVKPTPTPSVTATFHQLSADSPYAGSYSADVEKVDGNGVQHQLGDWAPYQVFGACVTAGDRAIKIDLWSRYDYQWMVDGNQYCLKAK